MITLRNIGHYIIFAMVVYIIGNATEVHTYKGIEPLIGFTLSGGLIGLIGGFLFDLAQEKFDVGVFNKKDVKRSAIGGLFGGALAFLVGSDILFWIFICICLITLIFELYFNFYKKIKR